MTSPPDVQNVPDVWTLLEQALKRILRYQSTLSVQLGDDLPERIETALAARAERDAEVERLQQQIGEMSVRIETDSRLLTSEIAQRDAEIEGLKALVADINRQTGKDYDEVVCDKIARLRGMLNETFHPSWSEVIQRAEAAEERVKELADELSTRDACLDQYIAEAKSLRARLKEIEKQP